jgi:arylsulfatase A-like enzyme
MGNVILLTIDALRRDVLGCYGDSGGLTPFIDSIQNRCIRFTKAQSIGPYTQASFPGILTSSYYLEYLRQEREQEMLSHRRTLISEVLHRHGITTAAFHSNAYLWDCFGWNRGWSTFYDSSDEEVDDKAPYITSREMNRKAKVWLSSHVERAERRPFFLWLHYMDIHEPYVPEGKYIDMVDPTIDLGEDAMFTLFEDVLLKRDVSDRGVVELLKKLYRAHVREVDDAVREFFEILEGLNILKDTVIIITSDHGDEFGEHGGLSHDGKMYSELIDIPLIIVEPNRKKQEVCDKLVSNIDLPPTVAKLFGLRPVEGFEGRSLLPLEEDPVKGCYGEALDISASHEGGGAKEVHYYREGDLKIIFVESENSWELYDLGTDAGELNDLSGTSPVAEAMKAKLMSRIGRSRKNG